MSFDDDDDPESTDHPPGRRGTGLLRRLGPGLITGASDDDPSGIATYAQAGAQFGYDLGWSLILTFPLMATMQMICARIGRASGIGIAGVLRLHTPGWVLNLSVLLLLVANVINLSADLGAMADAAALLLPGPRVAYVPVFTTICIAMPVLLSYRRYLAVLKWLTLALFAYVASALLVDVDWPRLARSLIWPPVRWNSDYLTTLVAIAGTTISPYLFFWQASEEVEDLHAHPHRRDLLAAPEQAPAALARIEWDTLVGMALSNLIGLAIIITAGATLHPAGQFQIDSSAQAALALRPLAGPLAATLFAAGIIGTGLLAVPVLAGSAAYAIGEARQWRVGLDLLPRQAGRFYMVLGVATLVGMLIIFTPINPMRALFWSAAINGVIAVPLMAILMVLAARRDVLGPFAIRGWLLALGWIATLFMGLVVAGMVLA